MRISCGILLLVVSLVGMVLSFISDIVISSPISTFNGLEISLYLGLFFAVTFVGSIFVINSGT